MNEIVSSILSGSAGKANLHTHSNFCDGANTPEEMCEKAIEKGFKTLGFSSHSEMLQDVGVYIEKIKNLKELYRGRLQIHCGIEMELGLPWVEGDYEYVIGSIHCLKTPTGRTLAIDSDHGILKEGIAKDYGGDVRAFIHDYYAMLREKLSVSYDIVGHPDLLRKFNKKFPYFSEEESWYQGEVEATADAIAKSGKVVEINTGAISRGWMDDVYPSTFFRSLLKARGVKFILSSDAHFADALDCGFERFALGG